MPSSPPSPQPPLQGYLGQPSFGFPEPLRSRILKGKPAIAGRPGASMPAMDLVELEAKLKDRYGPGITKRDVMSSAMYPKARGGGFGGVWGVCGGCFGGFGGFRWSFEVIWGV